MMGSAGFIHCRKARLTRAALVTTRPDHLRINTVARIRFVAPPVVPSGAFKTARISCA